jgi:biopolymer transport protein ExbD
MTLELERPSASSSTMASSKAIRLFIDKAGDIYLDGEPIRVWQTGQYINIGGLKPSPTVF